MNILIRILMIVGGEAGVLAPGAKEEVIRRERMAFSFVHQTTTEKVCEE